MSHALGIALMSLGLAAAGLAQHQLAEVVKQHLPPQRYPTAAVALGDLDGDGDLDLVAASPWQANKLYLNDGAGRFADATQGRLPPDGDQTTSVVLFDADGDGDLDVVFGNAGSGWFRAQSRLYLNDGRATFRDVTATNLPPVLVNALALAAGDVDADGDLDLALGETASLHFPAQTRLWRNDGRGRFQDVPAGLPTNTDVIRGLAFADLDGDLDLDLVLANDGGRNRLFLNDGTGSFSDGTTARLPLDTAPSTSVRAGDVDGDGDLDLVFGNGQSAGAPNLLYLNDGRGTFTDRSATHLPQDRDMTRDVRLADVDGDRDLDLIAGNAGPSRLYLNGGSGVFADATGRLFPALEVGVSSVATGDVDGDGRIDFVAGAGGDWREGERSRLYVNIGNGAFADATAGGFPLGAAPHLYVDVVLRDFDGDGDKDVVFAKANRLPDEMFLNDGAGGFTAAPAAAIPPDGLFRSSVAAGDVDGDGDADLVFGTEFQTKLYLNDGSARFNDATAQRLPDDSQRTFLTRVALADVDGDLDLDLLLGRHGYANGLYLNDGTGRFTDVSATHVPDDRSTYTLALALGDIDGDGDLDVAVGNLQQNSLYLNDGRGRFTNVTAARLPAHPLDGTRSLAFADVDGDGDLDLIVGNRAFASRTRLYRNDGQGTFRDDSDASLPMHQLDTYAIAAADLDEDGDVDLLLGNGGPSAAQPDLFLVNDGTGRFQDRTSTRFATLVAGTHALALGDVDQDGDLDVVAASYAVPSTLYHNRLRHASATGLARIGAPFALTCHARAGFAAAPQVVAPYLNLAPAQPKLDVPPYGAFGVGLPGLIVLPPLAVPAPSGEASLTLAIPNLAGLAGRSLYVQLLVAHGPEPRTWRFSNVHAERIGR